MSDYISKTDAIHVARYAAKTGKDVAGYIENLPAADVVEVVHGEWIYGENDYDDLTYYCSVCKEPWTLIEGTPQENKMHYCPNCGAKMDGGADNG